MSVDLIEQQEGEFAPVIRRIDSVGPAARISAALDDVAMALSSRRQERGTSTGTYAEGYFSALCFAVSVLTDEAQASVASRALRRACPTQ